MLTGLASKVASAKRGTTAEVTYASVPLDTLDLTVRRKWINVPHCNVPTVILQPQAQTTTTDIFYKAYWIPLF